jgi:hypothetical protein
MTHVPTNLQLNEKFWFYTIKRVEFLPKNGLITSYIYITTQCLAHKFLQYDSLKVKLSRLKHVAHASYLDRLCCIINLAVVWLILTASIYVAGTQPDVTRKNRTLVISCNQKYKQDWIVSLWGERELLLYPGIIYDNRPRKDTHFLGLNFCRRQNNNLALAQTLSLALGAMAVIINNFNQECQTMHEDIS